MLSGRLKLLGWLLFFCQSWATAQVDVTYPVERIVFQRNNSNQASVQVAGSYSVQLDAIEARAVPRAAGQGTETAWTLIQNTPTNGQFNGFLTVQGGWYKLEVRGKRNGAIVGLDSVSRFGVGEVFAIVGHSNAQGSSCHPNGSADDYCPTRPGPNDERVVAVPLPDPTSFYQYELTADSRYLLGLYFVQPTTTSGLSPFARIPWLWARMGEVLVARTNVPVLFYNGGFGGTNMEYNYKAAYDIPFTHSFVNYNIRMPYATLKTTMNLYVPSTGIRAVLLLHGENDRDNPADSTYKYNYKTIEKSRIDFNKPNLAWIMALSSFVSGIYQNVRQPQQQVIAQPGFNVYQGPDLDNIQSVADRPDGIHYSPSGQNVAGEMWANAVSDQMLATIQPYLAEAQPLAAIACGPNNTAQLTQPDGFTSYRWNTGDSTQTLTVGAGTYSARIRNAQMKVAFPPAVSVPPLIRPATPTITAMGSPLYCQPGSVVLASSYGGPNTWNGAAGLDTYTVPGPGSYTVQSVGVPYNCLSGVATFQVNAAGTDLAMSLVASKRIVAVGDTVSYFLTVENQGACVAKSVTWQNLLPPYLQFVSSAHVTASGNALTSDITDLLGYQSVVRHYTALVTAPGVYQNAAQLIAQTEPDPDSQPNSGTGDGQDDTAMADLRTIDGNPTLYVSPNPNQTPLPAVISNQPAPVEGTADLSLRMQSDMRTAALGQPITISLVVSNMGVLAASGVQIQCTLPAGLAFVSSASGMSASGNIISGTLSTVGVNQSATLTFVAALTAAGTQMMTAEITAAGQPDPDSAHGNGTANGEDDTAQLDLRADH